MSVLIKNLQIKNFKSVRNLSLDCDRINIFIGKPNAGKSNILEAISLLGVNYPVNPQDYFFLENIVRYQKIIHLFNNFNIKNPIEIIVNGMPTASLKEVDHPEYNFQFSTTYQITNGWHDYIPIPSIRLTLKSNGALAGATGAIEINKSLVKRYEFRGIIETKKNGFYLHPPHGDNFYSVVESNQDLRYEIQQFLKPNGLEFLLDIASQHMSVIQKTATTLLNFPLTLVPDTFQRYIFHLAAILSNHDSVLLFEEPETHSYAPYIYQIAQHILQDDRNNQYFLTTHNPYLLTPILQETKEVALFITWFEDYQTHARRLSEAEVSDILNYGIDVFLNLNHFIPE